MAPPRLLHHADMRLAFRDETGLDARGASSLRQPFFLRPEGKEWVNCVVWRFSQANSPRHSYSASHYGASVGCRAICDRGTGKDYVQGEYTHVAVVQQPPFFLDIS